MCYPQRCPTCGKTGWAGCGQHVDDVMHSVPASQRCTCNRDATPQPRTRVGGSRWRAECPEASRTFAGSRRTLIYQ
ncbi:MAG TPA: hypothetical protein VET27_02790 [Mycobacterium sp.]|nr:hypothetical protein [Mycobacterium sp.]